MLMVVATFRSSLISGKGKGGKARAKNLSPERLSEIAKKAAAARWGGKKAVPLTKPAKQKKAK